MFSVRDICPHGILEPRLFELVKVEPKCNQSSKEGVIGMIKFYNELLLNDKNYVPDVEEEIPSERWNFCDLKDFRDNKKQKCIDLGYSFISDEMSMIIKALERNYYWYGGGIIKQLLKGAYSEVSFYGKDEETGLNVKGPTGLFQCRGKYRCKRSYFL